MIKGLIFPETLKVHLSKEREVLISMQDFHKSDLLLTDYMRVLLSVKSDLQILLTSFLLIRVLPINTNSLNLNYLKTCNN